MIKISTKNNLPNELKVKEMLEVLLARYDLEKYEYAKEVIIETKVIPHSHPVLTLNTRYIDKENLLLSTYIHEQLHWYLGTKKVKLKECVSELREIYPEVPVGKPEGGRSEFSTYLHLVLCLIEYIEVKSVLGDAKVNSVWDFLITDHYSWVYKKVIDDYDIIHPLCQKYDLLMI